LYKQKTGNAALIAAKNAKKGRKFTSVRQNLLQGTESRGLQEEVKFAPQSALVRRKPPRLFSPTVMPR